MHSPWNCFSSNQKHEIAEGNARNVDLHPNPRHFTPGLPISLCKVCGLRIRQEHHKSNPIIQDSKWRGYLLDAITTCAVPKQWKPPSLAVSIVRRRHARGCVPIQCQDRHQYLLFRHPTGPAVVPDSPELSKTSLFALLVFPPSVRPSHQLMARRMANWENVTIHGSQCHLGHSSSPGGFLKLNMCLSTCISEQFGARSSANHRLQAFFVLYEFWSDCKTRSWTDRSPEYTNWKGIRLVFCIALGYPSVMFLHGASTFIYLKMQWIHLIAWRTQVPRSRVFVMLLQSCCYDVGTIELGFLRQLACDDLRSLRLLQTLHCRDWSFG